MPPDRSTAPRAAGTRIGFGLGLFILLLTAAYLGLPVLGWGGFAGFFAHPALIALAAVLFALTIASLFTAGNLSSGVREGSRQPLGLGRVHPGRAVARLAAGLHRPA
ncbi:MAG: hypothetical protein WDN69_07390 [Aliidongia sp.]